MRESSTNPGNAAPTDRMAGIELMRAIAVFGVIVIHAGLVVRQHVTAGAIQGQLLFTFVVPFFLLTSFFFALRGERGRSLTWREWIGRRAPRLLIPYFAWTVIYLVLRMARFHVEHGGWGREEIFQDPIKILITGGTSVALYFLPLLFTGWVLIHLLRSFLLQAPAGMLVIAFLVAAVANQVLQQSGNGYDVSTGKGFGVTFPAWNEVGPVRLLLVILAHVIRSLPLIFVAAAAVRRLPEPGQCHAGLMLAAGLVLCAISACITLRIGNRLSDLTWGGGTFVLAWIASAFLTPTRLVTLLGAFSFGVYLVHQVVLEAMQALVLRMMPDPGPTGIGGILAICGIAFGCSLLIVGLAAKTPLRPIFGLESQPRRDPDSATLKRRRSTPL